MAKISVNGEQSWRAQRDRFAISPTSRGYQIEYSANGTDWTADADAVVPQGENLVYLGAMVYGWYRMKGNTDNNVDILV